MSEGIIGTIATVIVSIIGVVSVAIGATLAARGNAKVKRIEATTPSYDQMAARVTEALERVDAVEKRLDEEREKRRIMEDRVDHLEDDRRHDRAWIERTIRKIIDHDPKLARLLVPWPGWYRPTTPPTPD